jgi:hypothetical protein
MSVKMIAPTGLTGIVQASKTLTKYTIADDGTVVVAAVDVDSLQNAGFTVAARDGQGASGLGGVNLPLLGFKNTDGTTLTAAAAAGKFGLSVTFGTSEKLLSESANSNTKTDASITEVVLPPSYVAGQDIALVVNGQVSGALDTKTVAADARKIANDGTQSAANLIATAAQALGTDAGDLTFVISGATLNAGDRLGLKLTMVLTESAAAGQTGQINSVRLI